MNSEKTIVIMIDKRMHNIILCSNGCPSEELLVFPKDNSGATAGCNFCGKFEDAENTVEAIDKWNQKQQQDSGSSSLV